MPDYAAGGQVVLPVRVGPAAHSAALAEASNCAKHSGRATAVHVFRVSAVRVASGAGAVSKHKACGQRVFAGCESAAADQRALHSVHESGVTVQQSPLRGPVFAITAEALPRPNR